MECLNREKLELESKLSKTKIKYEFKKCINKEIQTENVREVFEELAKTVIEYKDRAARREKLSEIPLDKRCTFHKGFIKSQYCETCDTLVCLKCQVNHTKDDGHNVIGINDIIVKIMNKVKENDYKYNEERLEGGIDVAEILASKSDHIIELKDEIKKEVNEIIEEVFEAQVLSRLDILSDQYQELINKFGTTNVYHIEHTQELLNTLLYKDHNYQKIVEMYKDVSSKKNSVMEHLVSVKEIQLELARLANVVENIRIKIKNDIKSALRPDVWERELEKILGLAEKDQIYNTLATKSNIVNNWTNGSKIHKGGDKDWVTFCTEWHMPSYFKCSVKIKEMRDPEEGGRFVGVSTNKCNGKGSYYEHSNNWWALNNNLGLWCKDKFGQGRGKVTYGDDNDVVTIVYDRSKRLSFEVNGISTDDYFDNVQGPLYVACADRTNSHYEIISILML